MDRLRHSPFEAVRPDGQTRLPRRLLRHLIVSHGIGVGSHVLDVGCGSGELTGYLSFLGIDVTGLDSTPAVIAAARRAVPDLDFQLTRSEQDVPSPDRQFDLVIVRELNLYGHNLASGESLGTTARLLSALRPGGTLVFLAPVDDTDESPPHSTTCFQQHLSCFPGDVESALFQDGILQQFVAGWFSRQRSPRGHLVTKIQIPLLLMERSDWLRHAESAAATDNQPCCQQGGRSARENIHSRAA